MFIAGSACMSSVLFASFVTKSPRKFRHSDGGRVEGKSAADAPANAGAPNFQSTENLGRFADVASAAGLDAFAEAGEIDGLAPGTKVTFTLVINEDNSYVESVHVLSFESLGQHPLEARWLQTMESVIARDQNTPRLQVGQLVPDFTFTDQTRKIITRPTQFFLHSGSGPYILRPIASGGNELLGGRLEELGSQTSSLHVLPSAPIRGHGKERH
jgi:hypothetical protein